jgi:hypothetical protein
LLAETDIDINAALNKVMVSNEPLVEKTGMPEATTEKVESESESESEEINNENVTSCTLMSRVDPGGGGLKLVIKKTPEMDIEVKQELPAVEEPETFSEKTYPIKKKSIFKSRTKEESGSGNSKRLALYKHNWNSSQATENVSKAHPQNSKSSAYELNDFELGALTRITSEANDQNGKSTEDVTKEKCDKKDKDVS